MAEIGTPAGVTEDELLGRKIRYRQLETGHRTGFEPVLLAASVAARAGERVLEAGCGAGAALLCLGYRVPGISGLGVEIRAELAALANENFRNNDLVGLSCVCSEVETLDHGAAFDHAMGNPPWHDSSNTRSPHPLRALAHHAGAPLLAAWIERLGFCLKPRGSLSLILPTAQLAAAAAGLKTYGFGAVTLFPLWPRPGQGAKLMIIAARKGSHAADRVLPGIALHDASGISAAAQQILQAGAAIDLCW